MKLIIFDILSRNLVPLNNKSTILPSDVVLALTPSSFYYLEKRGIKYLTFHDLISTEDFRNKILDLYEETLIINQSEYTRGFLRDIAQFINHSLFLEEVVEFTNNIEFEEIHYYTDKTLNKQVGLLSNSNSSLIKFINFDKTIILDKAYYNRKNILMYFYKFLSTKYYLKAINVIFNKKLNYDWLYISPKVEMHKVVLTKTVHAFKLPFKINKYIDTVSFNIDESIIKTTGLKTFLSKDEYVVTKTLIDKSIKLRFFQHGSYLYNNIFIRYAEVEPATINFVFNDYTKKLFYELGAKRVHSVGSVLFNKHIKDVRKQYDFLYITQGHDYLGSLQYVDFQNSLHSYDGYELYQRHKKIIQLFGTRFRDKKIIIRLHPCVVTTGVYVPLWELAEPFPNVKIDVSIPIHNLIERSKYIISDYFTTEFINRQLHYIRDIILFRGAPTPIPEEIVNDMKKMFILVDTVEDLYDRVKNIEEITKNRKRYDDIIEYYSSKKCDTKKVVTEILEKELNA